MPMYAKHNVSQYSTLMSVSLMLDFWPADLTPWSFMPLGGGPGPGLPDSPGRTPGRMGGPLLPASGGRGRPFSECKHGVH